MKKHPSEKATELLDIYEKAIWKNGNPHHIKDHKKECALTFCDEVKKLLQEEFIFMDSLVFEKHIQYWDMVKEAINKQI